MIPYEKAIDLVTKMDVTPHKVVLYLTQDEIFKCNKKASLIAVDEILKFIQTDAFSYTNEEYWKEVKKEIEKL